MIIALGSDHRGFDLKHSLAKWLKDNHEVIDTGTDSTESVDYPDFALKAGRLVGEGKAQLGILICGTGIGMCIAANKVRGVRAARVCTAKDAEMSKRHNNSNVLCMGADSGVSENLAREMIAAWLEAEFEGGRHERRVGKIAAFENDTHI